MSGALGSGACNRGYSNHRRKLKEIMSSSPLRPKNGSPVGTLVDPTVIIHEPDTSAETPAQEAVVSMFSEGTISQPLAQRHSQDMSENGDNGVGGIGESASGSAPSTVELPDQTVLIHDSAAASTLRSGASAIPHVAAPKKNVVNLNIDETRTEEANVPSPVPKIAPKSSQHDEDDEVDEEIADLQQTEEEEDEPTGAPIARSPMVNIGATSSQNNDPSKSSKETDDDLAELEALREVKFKVKTPAGKEYSISLHESSTVQEVKATLVKMNDIIMAPDEFKLIYKGKPLSKPEKTLKEIGVTNGAVLHMIKQLYGSAGNKPTAQTKDKSASIAAPGASVNGPAPGANIERSDPNAPMFINITIPEGARPGNRLIIQPPGRGRMIVYVPRGHGAGDILRVQLPPLSPQEQVQPPSQSPSAAPETPPQSQTEANNGNSNAETRHSMAPVPGPFNMGNNLPLSPGTVLKAKCPPNGRPGGEILVNVPNAGLMKVTIPPTARPGQLFFFRAVPTI